MTHEGKLDCNMSPSNGNDELSTQSNKF